MSQPPDSAKLQDWLAWLEQLHSQEIELGLDRLAAVARRLDLPLGVSARADGPFVFTVAGTNGKGTTCSALAQLSAEAGCTVGLYTSPHLLRFNERILINHKEVDDASLVAAFRYIESRRGAVSLTYFEYTTLAALWLFTQANLDVWVLEVGLGGRLDAVNLVDTDIAVLTTVGLDHQSFLGDNLAQIGREKAGIFRSGQPAVLGSADLPDTVTSTAQEVGALPSPFGISHGVDESGIWWADDQRLARSQLASTMPLPNQATAAQAFSLSPFALPAPSVCKALNRVQLSGRCQVLNWQGRRLVLDVGHNPHAARYLARQLGGERWHLVLGMLADKDAAGVAEALRPMVQDVFIASLDVPRGLSAIALRQKATLTEAQCYDSVAQAIAAACQSEDQLPVLVCGSFYTVAAALDALQ